jgi:putative flippase GtrA
MIRRSGADLPLLLRFVGVGASCALVYFSLCYAFQVQLGWSSFGATAVAYACSFGVGYSGQRLLTFRSTVAHRVSLSRYATLHVGGAVLTSVIIASAGRLLAIEPLYSAAISTILAGAASFLISLKWVFPDAQHQEMVK